MISNQEKITVLTDKIDELLGRNNQRYTLGCLVQTPSGVAKFLYERNDIIHVIDRYCDGNIEAFPCWDVRFISRDIFAHDILHAIQSVVGIDLRKTEGEADLIISYFGKEVFEPDRKVFFDLSKPLSEQSPECVAGLFKLFFE